MSNSVFRFKRVKGKTKQRLWRVYVEDEISTNMFFDAEDDWGLVKELTRNEYTHLRTKLRESMKPKELQIKWRSLSDLYYDADMGMVTLKFKSKADETSFILCHCDGIVIDTDNS